MLELIQVLLTLKFFECTEILATLLPEDINRQRYFSAESRGARSPVTIAISRLATKSKELAEEEEAYLKGSRAASRGKRMIRGERNETFRSRCPWLARTFQLYARNGPKQVPRWNVHIISRPDANKGAGHDFIRAAPS